MTIPSFPADFLWGVATAGHQNEGDNVTSDTWFLENVTPTIFKDRSGKATNGWELWESDLDIVAGLGLNAYRFSVEWARIEPVEGEFSDEALDHYEAIVDGCLARGLAPLVTFNHFTSPHWFAAARRVARRRSARSSSPATCGVVMDRFGDRIRARRHLQRARPARDADVGGAARRPSPNSSARPSRPPPRRRGRRALPRGQRDAARGLRRHARGHDGRAPCGQGSDQGAALRPAGRAVARDVRRRRRAGRRGDRRDRKRAEVYDYWLRLAGRRRLRRRAELRAARTTDPTALLPRPRAPSSTAWAPRSIPTRCAARSSTPTRSAACRSS